jgi:phospholipid-binding lipoprotein MlaA
MAQKTVAKGLCQMLPFACVTMLGIMLAGCATRPPASNQAAVAEYEQTNDPLEPMNRFLYRVNNALDTYVLRPAAEAYVHVLPEGARNAIHNELTNLASPVMLGNDILEAKPRNAGNTFMRMIINTTAGGLGLFDPATKWGYPAHDTDFGVTLAIWGAPEGPFLFLPLLGPSNPRDAAGRGVDIVADPVGNFGQGAAVTAANWGRFAINVVDARSRVLGDIDAIKKTALDPYATFRSLYRQHREAQIQEIRSANQHTVPAWFPAPAQPPAPAQ